MRSAVLTASGRGVVVAFLTLLVAAAPAPAQDWVTFTDLSATHVVADELDPDPLGLTDPFEKDLAAGDVDRDGDVDLVVVRKVRFSSPGGKRNALFLNDGVGVMTEMSATKAPDFADETDDRDVVLADVNGDGWLDVVTATTFGEQPRVYMNLQEDAGGEWLGFDWVAADNRIPAFSPTPKFCAIAAGDVDGDLDLDLFFVDYDNNLEDRLLINDGAGFFTDETDTRFSDPAMSQSAFGTDGQIIDVNGDEAADIVKVSTLSDFPNSVRIIYNDISSVGTFDFWEHVYTDAPYMSDVADYNNDTRPDIYVVDDGQDAYLLNQGNGVDGYANWSELEVTNSPSTASFGGNTVTADLDRDGYLDILIADVDTDIPGCDRDPVALRNAGDTPNVSLTDPFNGDNRAWLPAGTFDFAVADFDGDNWPDIWAGTCTGNKLFLSNRRFFSDGFESGNLTAWSSSVP